MTMSEIFSEKVVTSRRTYFFDVKETRDGSKYLVIGELTQVGNEFERHRVMVFEESLDAFVDGMDKAVDFIQYGPRVDDASEREGQRGMGAGSDYDIGDSRELRQTLERVERKIDDIRGHFK
jgi:hypothetical protein